MRIVWNTLSQIVGKGVSSIATLLISILIIRSFGIESYGDFTKITAYVAFFYLLSDFGLNALYIQAATSAPSTLLWKRLLTLRLVGSVFLSFVAISILAFLPQGVNQGYTPLVRLGIILFAPSIIFQAIITTANAFFQKRLRYDLSAVALSAGSVVGLLAVWLITLVVSPFAGAIFSAIALLLGTVMTAGVALFLVSQLKEEIGLVWDARQMKIFFWSGLPLGITLLFNQVYFRADSFVLALTRSTAEVGIYAFAYKIFEAPLVLPTFFMNALFPLLVAVAHPEKENHAELRRLSLKAFKVLLAGGILITAIFWLLAPLITLIRPELAQSVTPLRVLSLSLPIFFISGLTMWLLVTLSAKRELVAIYGASMLISLSANIVLIPPFGYMAAAWSTVVSEILVLAVSGIVVINKLKT